MVEYSQEQADKVCELIMDGYSLRKIEATDGMPKRLVILRWLRENTSFQTQYAHAREEQADLYADEILEISDDGRRDTIIDPETGTLRVDGDAIQRARLRVDSRKWIASKLKPKKYGDKQAVEIDHSSKDKSMSPAVTRLSDMTDSIRNKPNE